MKSSTRFAIIGTGVAVAAAGVIALLVIQGEPEDETTELSARNVALPELAKRDVEGGVVKPWDVKPPTAAELKERAEAEKAEAAELLAEQKKAEQAARDAARDDDPQLARAQAIEQARSAGILGKVQLQQGGAFASLTGTGTGVQPDYDKDVYGGLLGNEPGELVGGFGYGRPSTPGGGGTGWGTIGTGRYGTIGGARGSMRGRGSPVPSISIGQPNADGDLDKAIIRRYVRRNIQKIQNCYEQELGAKPKLAGTVSATFTILPSGGVSSASATGVDPTVSSCVAGVIKGIDFPKPKGGGAVNVTYPFTFRPAGS